MTTYLTWLPEELDSFESLPAATKHLRPFNACRPADAASKAALRASIPAHPYSVSVMVMRADHLGRNDGLGPRKYVVTFERSVKKVEVAR